ncbi:MAG: hypothetical protein LPK38_01275 [Actinomycetes bacterium]|jgi:hypothetical protein|nr:hypothetical protein [Actinomycetes bacterium]MDX5379944.1 hypothetical protein [Actinomycetes bacterium]
MSHHEDPFADMSQETREKLARAGVASLEDAARMPHEELLSIRGVAPDALARIVAVLDGTVGATGDRDPNEPE